MKLRLSIFFFILAFLGTSLHIQSQDWSWEIVAPMPEARSNNAVATAEANGTIYVYSFAGIDTTKLWSGISNKSFRYNVSENTWDSIPDLPMDITVIAAGANTIKNKIYIVGGYTVFANDNEVSSDQTFEFDPATNAYAEKANIPVAIDDQAQGVWRDSLLYVITGWSNTTNVANVQIYNPSDDTWSEGTPVPNNSDYKVFGGSGSIIGDTIYYAGGTGIVGSSFQLVPFLRKGAINPENPTEITWTLEENNLALGYRMAALDYWQKALWIGGALVSYNYNGIAYNGSGGVHPTTRILSYDPITGDLSQTTNVIPPIMDFRGAARISLNEMMLVGGMNENQTVTDQCFILRDNDLSNGLNELTVETKTLNIYPNLTSDVIRFSLPKPNAEIFISDVNGKIVYSGIPSTTDIEISTNEFASGSYFVSVFLDGEKMGGKFVKE